MKAKHILQSKGAEVFAVSPDDTIAAAVSVLNDKNIGAVVVRDNRGEAVGILSERDVVRRLKTQGADVLASPVSACMTANVVSCQLADTIDELMSKMTKRRIRHVPVVEKGALVGLVSIGDVVKHKIEITEQEAAALRDYITS